MNRKEEERGSSSLIFYFIYKKIIFIFLSIFFLSANILNLAQALPPSFVPSDEEPSGVKIFPPITISKKGEDKIFLFIDRKEVSIDKPILVKEDKVYLPLKEITSPLYFSFVDLKDGTFRLISPEGLSKKIKVSFMEDEPMISEEEVKDYFGVEAYFNASKQTFYIYTKASSQLQTYTEEKTEEELVKEKRLEDMAKKTTPSLGKPAVIPAAAKPTVQLRGNVSGTYIAYNLSPVYHSLLYSLSGQAYDFDLRYESSHKDINGHFDHDYTYLNLSKPGLFIGLFDQNIDLYPLRLQSQRLNGLKITRDWNEMSKTTFVSGDIENTVSGTSGSVKYLGNIYGIKEEFTPFRWLSLKGALLYTENNADSISLSETSSFPRDNIISFYETSLKLPYDLTFSTQLAQSYYSADNNADNSSIKDIDWRIGSELIKTNYKFGLNYELVGDKYASLGNPASYQDYSGWNFYGNYKLRDNWSLYSSFLDYHNNVDDDPNRITTDNTSFSLSSYYLLTEKQTLNLTFSRFITDPSGPNSGPNTKTNLYRLDYFRPLFFDLRSIVNYQYYNSDASDNSDYYSHTSGGSLFKSFGRGSSWYLNEQFIKTIYDEGLDSINFNTSFNLNYMLNPVTSLYFNSSYTRTKSEGSLPTDTMSGSTGLKYRLFSDTNLNLEYNINSYNLRTEYHRWPEDWSIMVYISQNFGLSTPPNFGSIEGWVFKDINGNAQFDNGEVAVEEARVYLEDKTEIVTSANGYFKFPYVVPAGQKIYLDLGSLSEEWTTENPQKKVEVKPRKSSTINFPLIKAGSIKGKVFIDENSDLLFQENEEPLENMGLILMPLEQFRRTSIEGDFIFDYLLPGKYKLSINIENIPVGYELSSPEQLELGVGSGEIKKDIYFALKLKQLSN